MSREARLAAVLLMVIGMTAVLMGVYATDWGPWVESDSVEYLESARNLASGRGLITERASGRIVPLYSRPPFYPVLLALMIGLGIDPVVGARWLDVGLFVLVIALVVGATYRATGRPVVPVLCSLYLLSAPAVLDGFTGLMTEPVFLAIVACQIVVLAAFLTTRRGWLLVLSSILAALSLMTRYAGAASLLVLALGILLWGPGRLSRRILLSIGSMVLAVAPFLVWTSYLARSGLTPGVYDLTLVDARQALVTARASLATAYWSWLPWLGGVVLGDTSKALAFAGMIAAGGTTLAWLVRRRSAAPDEAGRSRSVLILGVLAAAFSLGHTAVLAAAYLLVEFPKPAFYERVLLPSQVTFVLSLVLLAWYALAPYQNQRPAAILIALLIVPVVLGSVEATEGLLSILHAEGRGYTGWQWRNRPILAALDEIPAGAPIISNDIDAIEFFLHRPAFRIPDLEEPVPANEWETFGSSRDHLAERRFVDQRGYLVLFSVANAQFDDVYGAAAEERIESLIDGLTPIYEDMDWGIYIR